MRELSYKPYSGKPYAKIVGTWLRMVENIIDHIHITEDIRVNYATSSTSLCDVDGDFRSLFAV